MLSETAKFVLRCCRNHPDFDENNASREMQKLDELQVCGDLADRIRRIKSSTAHSGSVNSTNSWIAYYCGLTTAKPSGDLLIKPRLTYARIGFPDIDMDFCALRREKVSKYIRKRYGESNVAHIGTKQELKPKAALRRVIKVLDPNNSWTPSNKSTDFQFENEVLDKLPKVMKKPNGSLVNSLEDAYNTYPDFRKCMDYYPKLYDFARRMEGKTSAYGVHAGGIVISPKPLDQFCPLHRTTRKPEDETEDDESAFGTQYSMDFVEALGLIKLDILGISTKTAAEMTIARVKQNHNIDIDIENVPLDDPETLKLLNSGETVGCFQLESRGMRETLRVVGIDSFDDLAVCIALFRPGPLQFIEEYAQRKRNPNVIRYLHPKLKKITEKTYGIIVYQETGRDVFVQLAGMTPTQGYVFIKGTGKKKPELIRSLHHEFIKGCSKNNIPVSIAESIFKDMQRFSGYSFNLAHACSYAMESWRTAYLKSHFPAEYMLSRLTVESIRRKFERHVPEYEADLVRMGFKVLPPDLNKSGLEYTLEDETTVRRSLITKGVGLKAAQEIVKHQPYSQTDPLYDFAEKTGLIVNSRVVEAMCEAGIWGSLNKQRQDVIASFKEARRDQKKRKQRGKDRIKQIL